MAIVGQLYPNEHFVKIGALEVVVYNPEWQYNRSGKTINVYDDYSTVPYASGSMNPQNIWFLSPSGMREGWIAPTDYSVMTSYFDNRLGSGTFNGYPYARYAARKTLTVYDRNQIAVATLNPGDGIYVVHSGSTGDPTVLPDIYAGTAKREWMQICGFKKGETNYTIRTGFGWVDTLLRQGSTSNFGLQGRYI